ncbi:MAG: VanW family protein [Chloroflexota bacterium]
MQQLSQILPLDRLKLPRIWLPLAIILLAGGVLSLMILVTLIFQVAYLERAYPGISVSGISVSGLSQTEMIDTIQRDVPQNFDRPITIEASDESWTFTGQELGMRLDVVATADKAYAIGRQGNLFADMATHLTLLVRPRDIEPVIRYDNGPTNKILQELTDQINRSPQDAELVINTDATLEVIPAKPGRLLHLESARSLIETAIFSEDNQPVEIIVQEVLPARPDVDVAYEQAQNLLSHPIIFRANDTQETNEWKLEPTQVVEMVALIDGLDDAGKPQLMLQLDTERMTPYIEELSTRINKTPVNAKLTFDAQLNELVVLQKSEDGLLLDTEATLDDVVALLDQSSNLIELPVAVIEPDVSSNNLDALGIKELINESTSYFKGSSQGRVHNIALAASKFDGIVIPPDGIFSFNEQVGDVSKEAGFDESLIIFGDRTTVGIGGGVCQVSTTVFRSAFYGGFEIVERWAHGYRVGWYETNAAPGLDATIYTPDVDFKFRNDTGHHLLIETETDTVNGTLTFRFYGTNPDREVFVSEPLLTNVIKHGDPIYEIDTSLAPGVTKQIDWAKDGVDVTVTRVVKQDDEILHEDNIFSQYRPWQAVYKVGPPAERGS